MFDQQPAPVNHRPRPLSFLCILSFIGSGMGAVSNLFVYLFHQVFVETLSDEVYKKMGLDLEFFAQIKKEFFLIVALLQVVSFTGVLHMWQMRRSGFHLYAISQLMVLIVSSVYIYNPLHTFPMVDLLFAAIFILAYLRYRNLME